MPATHTKKTCRTDLKPGDCLCNHCTGKCCRYFSLPIETPVGHAGFDTIGLYLAHGQTLVYVENGTWYLVVMTRCQYLLRDNRCAVYFNRPRICREYTTDECEYDNDWSFEQVFESPAQVAEFADAVVPVPRGGARSRADVQVPGASFTLTIETPTTWDDFDAIRWYLAHGLTRVYTVGNRWYLVVLAADGTCPAIESTAGRVFDAPEPLWEYAWAVLPPRRRPKSSNAGPLVILGNPLDDGQPSQPL